MCKDGEDSSVLEITIVKGLTTATSAGSFGKRSQSQLQAHVDH